LKKLHNGSDFEQSNEPLIDSFQAQSRDVRELGCEEVDFGIVSGPATTVAIERGREIESARICLAAVTR
jgi:hypothetical protein